MKRISPDKRNQFIMVLLITAVLIGVVYSMLISPQNIENRKLVSQTEDRKSDLAKYRKIINEAIVTSNQLVSVSAQLDSAEQDIATGDVYAWTYDVLRHFKTNYHLDIPTISQPVLGDVDLIPNFPYKQVTISLAGTGYYHDLGKFVADFENNFPHMRLVDLSIQSAGDPNSASETLSFRMNIAALVKPKS